jgi:hypothetical protein
LWGAEPILDQRGHAPGAGEIRPPRRFLAVSAPKSQKRADAVVPANATPTGAFLSTEEIMPAIRLDYSWAARAESSGALFCQLMIGGGTSPKLSNSTWPMTIRCEPTKARKANRELP